MLRQQFPTVYLDQLPYREVNALFARKYVDRIRIVIIEEETP